MGKFAIFYFSLICDWSVGDYFLLSNFKIGLGPGGGKSGQNWLSCVRNFELYQVKILSIGLGLGQVEVQVDKKYKVVFWCYAYISDVKYSAKRCS